jgi:tetratricopeptide (TPR) repeat protein
VALNPNFAEAHYNLGIVLKDSGQLDESEAAFRHAIALRADYAEAHSNLALLLLVHGDFAEAWEEYEWRWKLKSDGAVRREFLQPDWDGRELAGRTILLDAEQGFGDTLQFIRYLPLVQERGGKVLAECQPELSRLLHANMPDIAIISRGETLPHFDVQCPLMSLPRIFGTDLTNIPSNIPSLKANPADVAFWREQRWALCGREIRIMRTIAIEP